MFGSNESLHNFKLKVAIREDPSATYKRREKHKV